MIKYRKVTKNKYNRANNLNRMNLSTRNVTKNKYNRTNHLNMMNLSMMGNIKMDKVIDKHCYHN